MPTVTVYGGYSEANRAPTPLELDCADKNRPCLLENSLVSDPPLKQVVAHTYEAGLRGAQAIFDTGAVDWKAGFFRTDSTNDRYASEQNHGARLFHQCAVNSAPGRRGRSKLPLWQSLGLFELRVHRRDLPVRWTLRLAKQSFC